MSLLTESVVDTLKAYVEPDDEANHKKYDLIPHCQYNDGVACELKDRKCKGCGCNPVVSEMRKQAIAMGDTHFLRFKDRDFGSYDELLQAVKRNVTV